MKSNILILTILTLVVLSFITGPTFATDGKNYPGAMGLPQYPNYSNYLERSTYRGSLENNSPKSFYVILPVIKDSQHKIHSGWVKVRDQNPFQDVSCCLNSATETGNSSFLWWSGYRSSTSHGPEAQDLFFGTLDANGNCHYFYDCYLPGTDVDGAKSGIISYHVEEYE